MKAWAGPRKPWQIGLIIAGGYLAAKVIFNLIWRRGGTTTEDPASWSALTPLLIAVAAAMLIGLLAAWALARSVGATVGGMELRALHEFRLPHVVGDQPAATFRTNPTEIVDQLAALGFEPAGAYEVEMPDHRATFACMLSPEHTTMAVVTPAHMALRSNFDGKLLGTADRATGAKHAAWVLEQVSPSQSPEVVWQTHQQALALLQERAHVPSRFVTSAASTTAVEIDRASIREFSSGAQLRSMLTHSMTGGVGPLGHKDWRRIEKWLAEPSRWNDPIADER